MQAQVPPPLFIELRVWGMPAFAVKIMVDLLPLAVVAISQPRVEKAVFQGFTVSVVAWQDDGDVGGLNVPSRRRGSLVSSPSPDSGATTRGLLHTPV